MICIYVIHGEKGSPSRRQQQQRKDTLTIHRNEESVQTKLRRIAKKASTDKDCQFTSLYHLLNKELLLECFTRLKAKAAPSIDNIIKEKYAIHVDANLESLVEWLHKMAYRPQPVLRSYIPKPGSQQQRPLGIPTLEDKRLQSGLVSILQAIVEQDFPADSYGFRPQRRCHDALRALSQTVEGEPIHHMVETDIKGFFDSVDQEQLMQFIGHRILRLIRRLLKAEIQEDGQHNATASQHLPSLYFWFEQSVNSKCEGYARLIRYADDYVVCFQDEVEARNFMTAMEERLKQYNVELASEKTKRFECGSFAQAKARGKRTATFDFLGFTHDCSRSRDGRRYRMKRKTVSKRFAAKLVGYKEWFKANRTQPTAQIMKTTAAKRRGHFAYYGVTDNSKSVQSFAYGVNQWLFTWLNLLGLYSRPLGRKMVG